MEPLKIKIGNSVLSDIINCFDQFNDSKNVRKLITSFDENIFNKNKFNFLNKDNLINSLFPPFVSICSLFFVTTTFIYFYKINEENNVKSSNSKIFIYSNNSKRYYEKNTFN